MSTDCGTSWQRAKLGRDLGRFSFREFSLTVPTQAPTARWSSWRAPPAGPARRRPSSLIFNPAGYHHNVIQRLYVEIV